MKTKTKDALLFLILGTIAAVVFVLVMGLLDSINTAGTQ